MGQSKFCCAHVRAWVASFRFGVNVKVTVQQSLTWPNIGQMCYVSLLFYLCVHFTITGNFQIFEWHEPRLRLQIRWRWRRWNVLPNVASFYSYLCFLIISVGEFYVRTSVIKWEWETASGTKSIINRVAYILWVHSVLLDSLMNAILSIRVERTKIHIILFSVCKCMMHKTWVANPNPNQKTRSDVELKWTQICRQNDKWWHLKTGLKASWNPMKSQTPKHHSKIVHTNATCLSMSTPLALKITPHKLNERKICENVFHRRALVYFLLKSCESDREWAHKRCATA